MPREMSRADARLCFNDAIDRRGERERELRDLVRANGLDLHPERSSILAIGRWICGERRRRPTEVLQTGLDVGSSIVAISTIASELHLAYGATAASLTRTYSAAGVPVAERTTQAGVSGATLQWISGDANNTQDLEVNATTGAVTRRYADPYGNNRGAAATWSSGHTYLNAAANAFAGLVQLGARAYDTTLGRFLSVDAVLAPLNPQQNNGYSYSANNPLTNSDPDGRCYLAGSDFLSHFTSCDGGKGGHCCTGQGLGSVRGCVNEPRQRRPGVGRAGTGASGTDLASVRIDGHCPRSQLASRHPLDC